MALLAFISVMVCACGNQATKLKGSGGGGGNNSIGGIDTQLSCNIQKAHALVSETVGGEATQHRIRIQYSLVGANNPQIDNVRLNLRNAILGAPEDFCLDSSGNRIVIVSFGRAPAGGFAPLGLDVVDATNLSRRATCTSSSVEVKDYAVVPESERITCAAGQVTNGSLAPVAATVSQVGMLARFSIATPEIGIPTGVTYDGEIDFGEGVAPIAIRVGAGFSNAVSLTHIFNGGVQATKNYVVKIRRLSPDSSTVVSEVTQELKLLSAEMNPMPVYSVRNSAGALEPFSGTINLPRPQWPRDVIAIGPGSGKDQVTTVYVYHPATGKTVLGNIVSAGTPGAPVALGDINGDGHLDLVAGRLAGDGIVRITSGKSGLTQSFDPFGSDYNAGVWVAVMDTDLDGKHELVAGSQNDQVKVFSWQNGTMTLLSGINSSSGIKPFTNGEGNGMHVAGLGKFMTVMRGNRAGNKEPIAKVSAAPTLAAFTNLATFSNDIHHGQYVSMSYLDADSIPELLVCNEKDEVAALQIRSLTLDSAGAVTGSTLRGTELRPFGAGFNKGMTAALADVNNDGVGDIIAGSGEGTQTNVNEGMPVSTLRIFNGTTLTQIGTDYRPYGTKYVHLYVAGPPSAIR